MTRRVSFVAAACLAFAAAAFASLAPAQDAPKGNAENGKAVYMKDGCFLCHGRVGQGGGYNQPTPSLAKTAMPFEGFMGQLRQPSDDMPAYSAKVLSDQEVADIYAYVQSLAGRSDPKGIAILNN
jgi:mono/diheme cytochrome c family protein